MGKEIALVFQLSELLNNHSVDLQLDEETSFQEIAEFLIEQYQLENVSPENFIFSANEDFSNPFQNSALLKDINIDDQSRIYVTKNLLTVVHEVEEGENEVNIEINNQKINSLSFNTKETTIQDVIEFLNETNQGQIPKNFEVYINKSKIPLELYQQVIYTHDKSRDLITINFMPRAKEVDSVPAQQQYLPVKLPDDKNNQIYSSENNNQSSYHYQVQQNNEQPPKNRQPSKISVIEPKQDLIPQQVYQQDFNQTNQQNQYPYQQPQGYQSQQSYQQSQPQFQYKQPQTQMYPQHQPQTGYQPQQNPQTQIQTNQYQPLQAQAQTFQYQQQEAQVYQQTQAYQFQQGHQFPQQQLNQVNNLPIQSNQQTKPPLQNPNFQDQIAQLPDNAQIKLPIENSILKSRRIEIIKHGKILSYKKQKVTINDKGDQVTYVDEIRCSKIVFSMQQADVYKYIYIHNHQSKLKINMRKREVVHSGKVGGTTVAFLENGILIYWKNGAASKIQFSD